MVVHVQGFFSSDGTHDRGRTLAADIFMSKPFIMSIMNNPPVLNILHEPLPRSQYAEMLAKFIATEASVFPLQIQ